MSDTEQNESIESIVNDLAGEGPKPKDAASQARLRKQRLLTVAIIAGISLLMAVVVLDAESDGSNDGRTQVDEEAEWLNAELQNSGDDAKSFIDSSEAKITQLEDTLTTVIEQNPSTNQPPPAQISGRPQVRTNQPIFRNTNGTRGGGQRAPTPSNTPTPPDPTLVAFNLNPQGDGGVGFNIDEYLPAGSYASATVIGGVDAAVGVDAQSDPRPILMRVTSKAYSAEDIDTGKLQTVDIRGCLITAATYGDLSSERVHARLQLMTCSRKGRIIETAVFGLPVGQGHQCPSPFKGEPI